MIVRAQGIEPILARLDHALAQLLVRRPARGETTFGIQVSGAALVVEPIVRNTAAFLGRTIAVVFCHRRHCSRDKFPPRRQIAAAAVTRERCKRGPVFRSAFDQAFMLANFDLEFQVVDEGQGLGGVLRLSGGQRHQEQTDPEDRSFD